MSDSDYGDDRSKRRKRLSRKRLEKQKQNKPRGKPRRPRFENRRPRSKKWDDYMQDVDYEMNGGAEMSGEDFDGTQGSEEGGSNEHI